MKIGILTFHRSINYGAVTQCFALAKRIQKDCPESTVEVIDYIPEFRQKFYKPSLWNYVFQNVRKEQHLSTNIKIAVTKCIELIKNPRRYHIIKNRFETFQNSLDILPLSEIQYNQDDPEEFRKVIKDKYDIIIVGSDCVWEWSTVGIPSAYYLPGDFGTIKMSFAASAGTDSVSLLNLKNKSLLSKAISEFSYVGIRDTSTEYVVGLLCPLQEIHHNCDPTTLLRRGDLDEVRKSVKKKLENLGVDFSKPIIGIMGNEILGKLAHDIFGDKVNYVGVYVPNNYCNVFLPDLKVIEWASIFGLFDLTFTTFFHGTMLSLVNETSVLSFDYLPETASQITKLHELYNRLDLPGYYHRGKSNYTGKDLDEIKSIATDLIKKNQSEKIRNELDKESKFYDSFLENLKMYLQC